MADTTALEQMLRGAALRVTRPRVAVLAAVHECPHSDTKSLVGLVRDDLGEVSQQAVYDALRALTDAGLVRRIHPPDSVPRYEARVGDDHHHLVCRSCGAIVDVDAPRTPVPRSSGAAGYGYAIEQTEVMYRGLCPDCRTERSSESTS